MRNIDRRIGRCDCDSSLARPVEVAQRGGASGEIAQRHAQLGLRPRRRRPSLREAREPRRQRIERNRQSAVDRRRDGASCSASSDACSGAARVPSSRTFAQLSRVTAARACASHHEVLLDVRMPEMDGLDVQRRLLAEGRTIRSSS
jgi:CheY-like chemotaxis protein